MSTMFPSRPMTVGRCRSICHHTVRILNAAMSLVPIRCAGGAGSGAGENNIIEKSFVTHSVNNVRPSFVKSCT